MRWFLLADRRYRNTVSFLWTQADIFLFPPTPAIFPRIIPRNRDCGY